MAGPRLVLLDEPAGGVNLTMLGHLRERLQADHAENKATFVVIEHNMEFVMALCTRVLVLAEGSMIARGHASGDARATRRDRSLSRALNEQPMQHQTVASFDRRRRRRRLRQDDDPERHHRAYSPRRDHDRDRPERRRQVDGVQDDLRPAAGAQRQHPAGRPRHHQPFAARPARRRRRLRPAGPQYFPGAERAAQSGARRRRAGRPVRFASPHRQR